MKNMSDIATLATACASDRLANAPLLTGLGAEAFTFVRTAKQLMDRVGLLETTTTKCVAQGMTNAGIAVVLTVTAAGVEVVLETEQGEVIEIQLPLVSPLTALITALAHLPA